MDSAFVTSYRHTNNLLLPQAIGFGPGPANAVQHMAGQEDQVMYFNHGAPTRTVEEQQVPNICIPIGERGSEKYDSGMVYSVVATKKCRNYSRGNSSYTIYMPPTMSNTSSEAYSITLVFPPTPPSPSNQPDSATTTSSTTHCCCQHQ